MIPRIAIVTDDPGWHGAQLLRAYRARGCDPRYVSLQDCRIDLAAPHGIVVPGFDGVPDGVFVRGVPTGTLEQVILRLDMLHGLRELGVPVYNDARAVEKSVDKAMTSLLLHRAEIPTPPTWVTESADEARAILRREGDRGFETVLKPLFGSQGMGLRRLRSPADLPDLAEYRGVAYLQRYIDTGEGRWHDWRVLVIGGRAAAAMIRHGASWVNNVAQGARCERAALDPVLRHLAEAATAAVGMDYAGVDLLRDRTGQAFVVEVNSIPAWKGLQGVTDEPIAERLVDDFLARRLRRPSRQSGPRPAGQPALQSGEG